MKKISELDTKTFLCGPSAIENSYLLVNYEDEDTDGPVTYKASIQALGKALLGGMGFVQANEYKNGLVTLSVSDDVYVDASINLDPPYVADVSDIECKYILMDPSYCAYTVDSEGTVTSLGYPVFYDSSTGKAGYYDAGVFTPINQE